MSSYLSQNQYLCFGVATSSLSLFYLKTIESQRGKNKSPNKILRSTTHLCNYAARQERLILAVVFFHLIHTKTSKKDQTGSSIYFSNAISLVAGLGIGTYFMANPKTTALKIMKLMIVAPLYYIVLQNEAS